MQSDTPSRDGYGERQKAIPRMKVILAGLTRVDVWGLEFRFGSLFPDHWLVSESPSHKEPGKHGETILGKLSTQRLRKNAG